MASSTEKEKDARRAKVREISTALPIVSDKRMKLEARIYKAGEMVKTVKDDSVKAFFTDGIASDNEALKLYDADIIYLRKQLIYHSGKLAEGMTVEKFARFAVGLADLVS